MKWVAIGLVALVVMAGGVVGLRYRTHTAGGDSGTVQGTVTSLAIVPFYNATGDASLNSMGSVIADALNSDIGHSAHLRMVSPDRLQQVLHDLGVSPESPLDVSTLTSYRRVYARRHHRLRQVRTFRPADAHQRDRA